MKKSIGDLIDTYTDIGIVIHELCDIANNDATIGTVSDTCLSAANLLKEYKEMLRARVVEL